MSAASHEAVSRILQEMVIRFTKDATTPMTASLLCTHQT